MVEYRHLPLTWPMAYTTAGTTAQSVKKNKMVGSGRAIVNTSN